VPSGSYRFGAPNEFEGTHGPTQVITETVHRPVTVFATSLSTYSQPLDGIIRAQAMYSLDEPAFIPNENSRSSAWCDIPRSGGGSARSA
jgi:hypothetical protein